MRRNSILLVACLTFLSSCAGTRIERITGDDFLQQAQGIEVVSTWHWTTYMGTSGRRAYLEFGQQSWIGRGPRITVFWTPLSELPEDIARQLEAGTRPWRPWSREANQADNTTHPGPHRGSATVPDAPRRVPGRGSAALSTSGAPATTAESDGAEPR